MNYQTIVNIHALAHLIATANQADQDKIAKSVQSLEMTPEAEQVLFAKIEELTSLPA